jgi:hypothetical protein
MFASWRKWRVPHVRWIYVGIYFAAGALAFVLGAGTATALIGALVATVVVSGLELGYRRRHSVRAADN